ncbi:hypothetical protein F511_27023 [Dorcoceras hygrometricum]|uniref:Uncharacterized protein n=1 Tax=Dorcoceras hygrometricum TaxID=472368 RepID=A0A2Z7CX30_9LAMI|nr:hypothetical protein F511_27023 [Dorcoceras hygrometricum]
MLAAVYARSCLAAPRYLDLCVPGCCFEDERVTPVYLISLLESVATMSGVGYHGYSAGRGFDPAGGAPGCG